MPRALLSWVCVKLRVLSYNIHRAIGVDRRFRPDRIESIVGYYGPDVVLLQEVDQGVPRSHELDLGRELARKLGYEHCAIGHNVALRRGRYGNATMSRWPILRERNIDLSIGLRKRRGCQHTGISVRPPHGRERRLEVFNLHRGLSARERERQVGLLVRSREFASLPFDVPCVVGGDFNDWRSLLRPIFVDLLAFRSATGGNAARERPMPTFPSFFPQGALDRVYYRGPLRLLAVRRCRLAVSRVASDHLPVITDFEIH
jgi:endonuclease/exonuclease/phosphatase family metal-dependent hydrolase